MKLIIAIIQDSDSGRLIKALKNSAFQSTKLATTGGFLKEGNTTLMIGCKKKEVDKALNIIENHGSERSRVISPSYPMRANVNPDDEQPVKIEIGGAIAFVLPVESFHRL